MKVRSIRIRDYRSFRGEHELSFVSPLTGEAEPVFALAGANGAGKSTVLELIYALVDLASRYPSAPDWFGASPLGREAEQCGVGIDMELSVENAETPNDPPLPVRIGVGEPNHETDVRLRRNGSNWQVVSTDTKLSPSWRMVKSRLLFPSRPVGGLTYLAATRDLALHRVRIEPPATRPEWLERVGGRETQASEIEQHWVWLNYLDLEDAEAGRSLNGKARFPGAVSAVQRIFGSSRRMFVREGRVRVAWDGPEREPVTLDQLPSGEKQIILLAGEIARRARPGMVCLIDEPELSLHPNLQHVLVGFLRSMAREFDMQFILATHSLEIIEALPATVRFLDGGSPMWQRAPERDAELLQAI